MSSPTELTIDVSVMMGVQKALQRIRRRSSLSSSKLFFGKGLSTVFDRTENPFMVFPTIRQVVSLGIL
jgi:hypothetical protein